MTQDEADAMQGLISAAVRVVRTPMTGVDMHSPMARAIFNLTVQLAAAGIIRADEAVEVGQKLPDDALDLEIRKAL